MNTKNRLGKLVDQSLIGGNYKAFIPPYLPPSPPVDLALLYPYLEKATQAIAQLNIIVDAIPNTALFMYMYVRKEALLSSQIEGTQSSFADVILFENDQKPAVSIEDVEEVSNYVQAINYGIKRMHDGFPLSLRLLREVHGVLLQGARGTHKHPGEFRRTQNWIGGTRPGNAVFVPPPPDYLDDLLNNLESFLHEEENMLPVLIKAGLVHVQFETIHPFLDGNGRLGRLLIILMLCEKEILKSPILYLSLYLKQNRSTYYNLLQEVRMHGNWEAWLEFFLNGITKSAQQAIETTQKINKVFVKDLAKINTLGRSKNSCLQVFEYLKKLPQVSVPIIAQALKISQPTVRNAIHHLVELDILKEVSKKKRDKVYVYKQYLKLLEEGSEPL